MTLRSIALLALAPTVSMAVVVPRASAQQIDSPYEFVETGQGARAFATYIFTDRGVIDLGPASGLGFGVGYTFRVSGPFNLDAQAIYFPTRRRVYDTEPVDSATVSEDPMAGLREVGESEFELLLLNAALRFDLTGPRTWHGLQPYALVGVGGALRLGDETDVPAEATLDDDLLVRFRNGFTGHLGAGVEAHLTERITVRADARDLLWKLHVADGFFVPGRLIDDEEWVQNAVLSLGLVLRF